MSMELNPGSNDDDSDMLEGLPPTTHSYRWKGSQQFLHVIDREYDCFENDQTGESSEWVVFTNLNEKIFMRKFINTSDRQMIKSWKSYSPSQQILLVKMSLPAHANALSKFHDLLLLALNSKELQRQLQRFPNARIQGPNKNKQPDNGWGPFLGGRLRKWPAVVLEVGVSERKSKLQIDAQWWLNNSNGDVKITLTMSVNRRNPQITINKWELENNRPGITQTVTLSKDKLGDDQEIKASGTPLLIEFNKLFLRDRVSPNEQDIQIEEDDLRCLARIVWMSQEF